MERNYDHRSAKSIFHFSQGLLHKSLNEAVEMLGDSIDEEYATSGGKGGLGQLVEKFYYGYEPNSNPGPDFAEAGVELKTTPLKKDAQGELRIKERLVCDMIDYCEVVHVPFEQSKFYRKSLMMLILFYLHQKGADLRDLKFLFSVLWQLKEKDLLIIRHDYEVIVEKIKAGKAHELSEGDTLYLGACRKGQKGDSLRKQPYSDKDAPRRAFSLKPAYMRTILAFVKQSGQDMATNTGIPLARGCELVSEAELATTPFEDILTTRLLRFKGQDYRQMAKAIGIQVSPREKSRYARVIQAALRKGLHSVEDAEEFRKAGIIVKTIRLRADGRIKESMSFENIDYREVYETDEWTDSRWYEIATSRFLFVVFRESPSGSWGNEPRYVLDKVFFWTMPPEDLKCAKEYWDNIRANVCADTLQDADNTFWRLADKRDFHVRPKAQKGKDRYASPVSGTGVPRKAYWFNAGYVRQILVKAYGKEWATLFENNKK